MVFKKVQIWSKIFCLLPLFSYSMFGRTAPWNCLRLHFKHKSVFFGFVCFFPFLFFTHISRSISSAMISLPSDNKKNLIRGSDITDWDYALTYSQFSWAFRYEISTKFSFLGSAKRNFLPLSRWGRLAKTSTITGYTEKKKKEIHVISRLSRYTCFQGVDLVR